MKCEDSSSVSYPVEITKWGTLHVSFRLMIFEAPLNFMKKSRNHILTLFLEGLYDPVISQMNSIDCRKVMAESANSEEALIV